MNNFVLLLDSGNSRLKWAVLQRGEILPGHPIAVVGKNLAVELDRSFTHLPRPSRVLIANVAGLDREQKLAAFVRARWQLEAEFIRSQTEGFGIRSGYCQPEKLGVDRWLAMIAVSNRYALPALIVDCGTAITLDVLDETGQHLGGMICPGLRLMSEALARGTAAVGLGECQGLTGSLAQDTIAGVHLGVRQAALGLIERVFWTQQAIHPSLSLIVTGGDAFELVPSLQIAARLAPELVLEGLAVVSSW